MNWLDKLPSYDTIWNRLIWRNSKTSGNILSNLWPYCAAIFSVDNVDMNNQHCLKVEGKTDYGLHLTAIQGVFQIGLALNELPEEAIGPRELIIQDGSTEKFINSILPLTNDEEIRAYVELVVGGCGSVPGTSEYRKRRRMFVSLTSASFFVCRSTECV